MKDPWKKSRKINYGEEVLMEEVKKREEEERVERMAAQWEKERENCLF